MLRNWQTLDHQVMRSAVSPPDCDPLCDLHSFPKVATLLSAHRSQEPDVLGHVRSNLAM
jgi:hypothetical protein